MKLSMLAFLYCREFVKNSTALILKHEQLTFSLLAVTYFIIDTCRTYLSVLNVFRNGTLYFFFETRHFGIWIESAVCNGYLTKLVTVEKRKDIIMHVTEPLFF